MAIVHETYDSFTMNTIDLTPLSLMINGMENLFLLAQLYRILKVEQRFSPPLNLQVLK